MILFALITLSCISAADNNSTAEIIAQDTDMNAGETVTQDSDINTEETLTNGETEVSDFSTLNTEITNSTTDTIQLTKNYTYNPEKDTNYTNGIVIDKVHFTVDGQGHTIDGAGLARIFNITANNVTLKNINFINGCSEFGGAITCENGNLTITDCNFINNKVTSDGIFGGAIGFNADSLTISNSKFIGNTANKYNGDSGSIFFTGNKLTITQSEFINNSAYNEGVMLAMGNAITISKSRFENNKAENGIIAISTYNSLIDECEFINNSAGAYVGVSNIMGTMTINNSYFANNTAERSTRLIHNSQYSTAIISNCVFENNIGNEGNYSIDNNYGTIYIYNNTINTQSSEIFNYGGNITSPCTAIALENKTIPVAVGQKTTLTAIITDDNGNLIEEAYYVYFKINDESLESTYNPETSKYGVEYIFNTVGSVPIDIACPSINITVKQGTCNVRYPAYVDLVNELNNCQNNTLELTKDYIYDPVSDFSYAKGIVINKANFTVDGQGHTIDGAGLARIFNITANNVTLKNINFINGNAETGGAIYCNEHESTILNSAFKYNYAYEGGAIYNNGDGLDVTGSKFAYNTAKYGGAIYNDADDVSITNNTFTNNDAKFNGGAIYKIGYMEISDSKFANNNAKYGGAIDCYDHEVNIENTDFTSNTAEKYGGAIYNENSDLFITCSNFTNNTAEYGGAIENRYYLNIYNSRLENNTSSGYGGAIDNDRGELTIENTQFTNNAAKYGGAIYNDNGKATINNTDFEQNTAKSGGAIRVYDGEIIIGNTQFTNNTASEYGGSIYNDGKTTIDNSKFTANNATEGNAIETGTDMTISNSEFIENGEDCIDVQSDAKITLNNVSNDVPLVNDTINMEILEAENVVYGNDINIKVQVNSSAISSLNSGKVVVKINNIGYYADVKDGIATIVIPKLNAGTYNTHVTYIENNISRAEIPVNFTVNKKDITINAKNAAYVINYGGTYKVSFKNVADGTKVTFTLKGKKIGTSTIKNGAASIKLTAKILKTAKSGKKNMIIKIGNSNYSSISKTVKITINKEKTKITAKAKTFKKSKKTKKYTITLKNSKGKAVKKAKVTLKVKGKTYTAKTNSKGKATFKITKLTKKGTYKAAIKYKGNNYYKQVTKNIKIKIK